MGIKKIFYKKQKNPTSCEVFVYFEKKGMGQSMQTTRQHTATPGRCLFWLLGQLTPVARYFACFGFHLQRFRIRRRHIRELRSGSCLPADLRIEVRKAQSSMLQQHLFGSLLTDDPLFVQRGWHRGCFVHLCFDDVPFFRVYFDGKQRSRRADSSGLGIKIVLVERPHHILIGPSGQVVNRASLFDHKALFPGQQIRFCKTEGQRFCFILTQRFFPFAF